MAEKGEPPFMNAPNPWVEAPSYAQPPHSPARTDNSRPNQPFTPRSSTFPDDSDSEFDHVEHTPLHSPGGPDYEDLPPSYEQAQAQALAQAESGHPIPNPNDLQVHQLVLDHAPDPDYSLPPTTQRRTPQAARNADGLGSTVPVTEVSSSTAIPVHQIPSSPPDPSAVLLSRALDFTKHAPDADLQYAPRLTRVVAIPQELPPASTSSANVPTDCHGRRGPPFGRGGPCGRQGPWQHPSPWSHSWQQPAAPEQPTDNQAGGQEGAPTQFLRSYAKALHTHSIRPAEFAAFLDGLNVLCSATETTPESLLSTPTPPLIKSYIDQCNATFFAPRGLRIRLASLTSLLSTLPIPSARGQAAAALTSALDPSTGAIQHANTLHPWIERLELDVPEPGSSILALRAMGERMKEQMHTTTRASDDNAAFFGDLPSSGPHRAATTPSFPPWGGRGPGSFPSWRPGARGRHGLGPGWGLGGDGLPWRGQGPPWGNRATAPGRGFGPGSGHGFGVPPWTGIRPGAGQSWEEWGEELGKRWGAWGENFGKVAEAWGENIGKRAEEWGKEIERKASGESAPARGCPRGAGSASASGQFGTPLADLRPPMPAAEPGQETGVVNPETQTHPKKPEDDDDDSSDSDSDSDSYFSSDDDDDDDDFEDPQALFIDRVREINGKAASAASKGKKSPDEIAHERDLAIEKAQSQKTVLELKIEEKREKRAVKRELRHKKWEDKKELRRKKRELRREGKPDREERRKMKEEWSVKKKEHKLLKQEKRREWREKRRERKLGRKGVGKVEEEGAERMVWVLVENLGD